MTASWYLRAGMNLTSLSIRSSRKVRRTDRPLAPSCASSTTLQYIRYIQLQGGRSLVWDVTVVSPLAASYVNRAATDAGKVADMAASRKKENTRLCLLHISTYCS